MATTYHTATATLTKDGFNVNEVREISEVEFYTLVETSSILNNAVISSEPRSLSGLIYWKDGSAVWLAKGWQEVAPE